MNINLADKRARDAVVKAESIRVSETVRYVGPQGNAAWTRKILKSTVDHDYDALQEKFASPEAIAEALLSTDPEIDMELFGQYLWNVSKVYVNPDEEIVFHVEQNEIVRTPAGKVKEKRPRQRLEANVDTDVPIPWSGRKIPKIEAIRKYLFSSKVQIIHINGLTYDFLFGMAKELSEENCMMLIGGGIEGKEPLVFRRGSVPYRGFLEGRVKGDSYVLLLHLSNMELRLPSVAKAVKESSSASTHDSQSEK